MALLPVYNNENRRAMPQFAWARLSERLCCPSFLFMRHLTKKLIAPLAVIALAGCAEGVPVDLPWQESSCAGERLTETTLFFGLSKAEGEVTDAEWNDFQKTHLTAAFSEGFTVINGDGYWQVPETGKSVSEKSKILIRLHKATPDDLAAIDQVIETYKTNYDQESVLRLDSEVCTAS